MPISLRRWQAIDRELRGIERRVFVDQQDDRVKWFACYQDGELIAPMWTSVVLATKWALLRLRNSDSPTFKDAGYDKAERDAADYVAYYDIYKGKDNAR